MILPLLGGEGRGNGGGGGELEDLPHGTCYTNKDGIAEVTIEGEICFTGLRKHLDTIRQAKAVNLTINSLAGVAELAYELHLLLKAKSYTRATVLGCAASAAMLIVQGCTKRRIGSQSWLMVHTPSTFTFGTAAQLRAEAKEMEEHNCVVREILLARNCPAMVIDFLTNGEDNWITPKQAFQCRLVDEIIPEPEMATTQATQTGSPRSQREHNQDRAAEQMTIELLHRLRREFKSEANFEAVLEVFCSSSRAASAGGHD